MFAQMAQQPQPQQGIPPQILQMLMQRQAQGGQSMPPQGMPQQMQGGQSPMQGPPRPPMPPQAQGMPQGASPSPQGTPPQGGGIPPQILQMLMAQMQKQAPQQLAAQGQNGDSLIAHLTPGEIMVPPEVQTPKVLATLKKDFKQHGVQPQQFTAGSPASSTNPKTGVPQYNFMSAFLPAALGVAGAAAAPFTGGASLGLSAAEMAAIGGGLGSAAGGLITGQSPTQAALSGLGSAAGGYALSGAGGQLGNLLGNSAAKAGGSATGAMAGNAAGATAGNAAGNGMTAADNQFLSNAVASSGSNAGSLAAGANVPAPPVFGSQALGSFNPFSSAGSALGGYIGSSIGAPPKSNSPNYPAGFNANMPAVGSLGSAQQQLGQTNSVQPTPTFANYNPRTNNPAAYNFGF